MTESGSQSLWWISKREVVAEQAMVAAKHPAATEVGLEILRRGGNAVDAAVATAFAAAVVLPFQNGIGGGGYAVIHLAREGRTLVIDYSFRAPLRAHAEMYELTGGVSSGIFGWPATADNAHQEGYLSMAVPGTVAGLALAQERFGTLSLAEVVAPAIRLAEQGIPVSWYTFHTIAQQAHLIAKHPSSQALLFRNGIPLRATEVEPSARLVNPALARTLRRIAEGGPTAFYQGEVAEAIVADIAAGGGILGLDDLAGYRAEIVEPLATTYRGVTLHGAPHSCGCPTVVESMNILEGFDLSALDPLNPERLHLLIEASRRAFADRYTYLCDPAEGRTPWAGLTSKEYAAERRATIDPRRHTPAQPGDPWRFQPGGRPERALAASPAAPDAGTTHLSVVDRDRNVVSLTQTLMAWSGVVLPQTGIVMNNGMYWFDPVPGRVNSVGPGKKVLSNMAPFVVLRNGRPYMAVGSPGGRRIMDTNMQVILNVVDHRLGMQAAVETPRVDASGAATLIDNRIEDRTIEALRAMGHTLTPVQESLYYKHFASPSCILIDPQTGRLHSGEDPYAYGVAMGL